MGGTPEAGRREGLLKELGCGTDSGALLSAARCPAFSLQTEGGVSLESWPMAAVPVAQASSVASVGSTVVCKMGSHTSSVLGDFVVLYMDASLRAALGAQWRVGWLVKWPKMSLGGVGGGSGKTEESAAA